MMTFVCGFSIESYSSRYLNSVEKGEFWEIMRFSESYRQKVFSNMGKESEFKRRLI